MGFTPRICSNPVVDGLAVVTPVESDGSYAVLNAASLAVDPTLGLLGERLSKGGVSDHKACQDLWTKYRSKWSELDATGAPKTGKPLDPTAPDQFCVRAVFEPELQVPASNDPASDAALWASCVPLALEDKIKTCRAALDKGAPVFDLIQAQQLEAFRNQRAWRLTSSSWDGDLSFDENGLRRAESRQIDVSRVRFSVFRSQTERLQVKAELRTPQGDLLFRSVMVLADGARREGLPLPLGSALRIECGSPQPRAVPASTPTDSADPEAGSASPAASSEAEPVKELVVRDTIRNGQVRAVFDEDLDSGTCTLVYSPLDMKRFLHRREKFGTKPGADPSSSSEPEDKKAQKEKEDCESKYREQTSTEQREESAALVACKTDAKAQHASCNAKDKSLCAQALSARNDACDAAARSRKSARERSLVAGMEACKRAIDEAIDPLLHLYGAQLLEVLIVRGSEPGVSKSWSLDPTKVSRLPLPGLKSRSGDYTVTAHLKGPQPLSVIYRPGPQQSLVTPGNAADLSTDLEFRALLRPRGIGGYFRNWRTFVTFPIRFSGLRFPAQASTLSSSSDITAVQLTGVRVGILGVIEPWNYDTRQNPSVIPVRFATGFNLYDLGTGKFAPAYLLGMSVTLPVLPIDGSPSARNLNSSLAIGAFWEVDLQRPHPFDDGNHFLLTFGIDFASLLSE